MKVDVCSASGCYYLSILCMYLEISVYVYQQSGFHNTSASLVWYQMAVFEKCHPIFSYLCTIFFYFVYLVDDIYLPNTEL